MLQIYKFSGVLHRIAPYMGEARRGACWFLFYNRNPYKKLMPMRPTSVGCRKSDDVSIIDKPLDKIESTTIDLMKVAVVKSN